MPYESGIRSLRLQFVRETTEGTTPADPDWLLYSDAVQSFEVSPTGSINPRGNVGSPDIANFNAGTESHEFSVTYDLQRWFSSSGDAAYDGMVRNADGALPASHSMWARARAGHNGTAGGGSFIHYVATGAKINTVTLGGEPESGEPIVVTLNYMCRKLRAYQVDQPASSTTLEVVSTDNGDTMNITIENEGAATTETKALTGTTPITTTASFTSIGAAWLASEPAGNVTISDGTYDLMVIYGTAAYGDREGDQGIPLLGSGSHGSTIGTAYENILGDTIERPSGTNLGIDADIASVSMTVENNIETSSTVYSIGKILSEGPRTLTLNASVFGPTASYDAMMDHLRAVENNIVWTLSGGSLTLVNAAMTSMGSIARDTGLALLTVDNTFQGKSLTIA